MLGRNQNARQRLRFPGLMAALGAIAYSLVGGLSLAAETKAAEEKVDEGPPLVRPYGIIKAEYIVGNGIETFGRATFTAPTAAAHPIVNPNHDEFASSIQLQQSRFGMWIGEGRDLTGRVEVDFVDPAFAQSSPIQGTRLRLRLAYITYQLGGGSSLTMGQTWDIFSPLNPASMNMVGVSFMAGNSAFLRPQLIYTYSDGGLQFSAALGTQSQNNSNVFNRIEYALIPTVAVQLGYKEGKTWVGVSAIGSNQLTTLPPADKEYDSTYSVNAFASVGLSPSLSLSAEAYYGKNGNALGLLTLGSGVDTKDVGGYVSAVFNLSPKQSLWLLAGGAFVLDADDIPLGYALSADGLSATRSGISGVESNIAVRGTYVAKPVKGLELYLEPYLFLTKHKLDAADEMSFDVEGSRTGFGTQIGSRFRF